MFDATTTQTAPAVSLPGDCTELIDIGFRFAFQPVVDLRNGTTVGHEALVRGLAGESASAVIAAIGSEHRNAFDQACRLKALDTAGRLGLEGQVYLNCTRITPDNLAAAIEGTRAGAVENGIAPDRIVLEFSNLELLGNPQQLDRARRQAREAGFTVLADNVGAGEIGLKRLAVLRPDRVKLDRSLIRGIAGSPRRQAIVHGIIAMCRALGARVIATGVETRAELDWLRGAGVEYGQGFLFGKPSFRPGEEGTLDA